MLAEANINGEQCQTPALRLCRPREARAQEALLQGGQGSELAQTLTSPPAIRNRLRRDVPVLGVVAAHLEMGELMGHQVLDQRRRCHDHAPVEVQRSVRCAACPALVLVSDENLLRSDSKQARNAVNPGGEFQCGAVSVLPLECRSDNLAAFVPGQRTRNLNVELPLTELNPDRFRVRAADLESDRATAVLERFPADEPAAGRGLVGRAIVPDDPLGPLANRGFNVVSRGINRRHHSHDSGRIDRGLQRLLPPQPGHNLVVDP